MNNDVDYPELLQRLMKKQNLTVNALAIKAGVAQSSLQKLVKGGTKDPSLTTVKALSKALGVSVLTFLQGDTNISAINTFREFKQAPLLTPEQAGIYREIRADDVKEWYMCPVPAGTDVFCLRVSGESMLPKFQEGDIIYIDPDQELHSGCVVVVEDTKQPEAYITMKVFIREFNGQPRLKVINPDWEPKYTDLDSSIKIIGVVIGKFSSLI